MEHERPTLSTHTAVLLAGGAVGLEALGYVNSSLGSIAWWAWLFLAAFVTISSIGLTVRALIQDLLSRNWMPFLVILPLIAVLLHQVFSPHTHFESTIELTHAFWNLLSENHGFDAFVHYGYRGRHAALAVLPSVFFVPSALTVHIGFAFPFLLGLTTWYAGMNLSFRDRGKVPQLSLLPIATIFTFPVIVKYYAHFEQTLFPVALAMLAIGWFLIMEFRLGSPLMRFINVMWIGGMLATSYTPGLAGWALLIVLMATTALRRFRNADPHSDWVEPCACAGAILFIGTLSFIDRTDLTRQMVQGATSVQPTLTRVFLGFSELFTLQGRTVVFSALWFLPTIIYLVAAFRMQLRQRDFFVAVFFIGSTGLSLLLPLFEWVEPSDLLHRTMVTIPVLLTAMLYADWPQSVSRLLSRRAISWFAMFGFASSIGLMIEFGYFDWSRRFPHGVTPSSSTFIPEVSREIVRQGIGHDDSFEIVVFSTSISDMNLNHYVSFFFRNSRFKLEHPNTVEGQAECEVRSVLPSTLVYVERGACGNSVIMRSIDRNSAEEFCWEVGDQEFSFTRFWIHRDSETEMTATDVDKQTGETLPPGAAGGH
jgi:hypothetical protein